jgi:hypothetical protein
VELFTLRTAQSAQEKDDFSTGARVHFARFPIVGGKVSAANRTTQMLRPRNNKNCLSHFLVKLDTMTMLQLPRNNVKASGCPAQKGLQHPGLSPFC